jgi:hypothetical protein
MVAMVVPEPKGYHTTLIEDIQFWKTYNFERQYNFEDYKDLIDEELHEDHQTTTFSRREQEMEGGVVRSEIRLSSLS